MNRPLFFFIGMVAIWPIWNLHAKPAPKLECLEPVYKFGTVDGSKPVSHTFQIRNAGNAELQIRKIHAPCGCTSFELPSKTLSPDETIGILVTVSLQGRKGQEEKSLFLETNEPSGMPFELSLRGVVGSGIEIQPPLMTLRKNPKSMEVFAEVTIRDLAKKPLAFLEAKSTEGKLEISSSPLKDGDGFVLRAKPLPNLMEGHQKDKIQIQVESSGKKTNLSVDALILIPTELIAAPSALRLDTTAASPLSRTIIVRSPGGMPFHIDSIDLPDELMTSKIEKMSGTSARVVIGNIYPKREFDGRKLILHIGGSKPRKIEIPIIVVR